MKGFLKPILHDGYMKVCIHLALNPSCISNPIPTHTALHHHITTTTVMNTEISTFIYITFSYLYCLQSLLVTIVYLRFLSHFDHKIALRTFTIYYHILTVLPKSRLTDHFYLYYVIYYYGTPYYTSTRYMPRYLTGVRPVVAEFQPFWSRNGFQPLWLSLNLTYQIWYLRVQNIAISDATAWLRLQSRRFLPIDGLAP